jgi:hypothetical protein
MELKYRGTPYRFNESSFKSEAIAGKYRGVAYQTQPEAAGVRSARLTYRGISYRFPASDLTHPRGMIYC